MIYSDPDLPRKIQEMNDEVQAVFAVQQDFAANIKSLAKENGVVIPTPILRKLEGTRVSKLTFKSMVGISRDLGFKVAAVLYEPPEVSGEVIRKAWEAAGRPHDFWELNRDA
jgi:hypothetical protein